MPMCSGFLQDRFPLISSQRGFQGAAVPALLSVSAC